MFQIKTDLVEESSFIRHYILLLPGIWYLIDTERLKICCKLVLLVQIGSNYLLIIIFLIKHVINRGKEWVKLTYRQFFSHSIE
jgi:hypothetical protein